MEIALAISIISVVIAVSNFVLSRRDKAVKDTKENHQELIEYQLKELKDDVKEIKKMLTDYKETTRAIIREEIDEHVKKFHKGE